MTICHSAKQSKTEFVSNKKNACSVSVQLGFPVLVQSCLRGFNLICIVKNQGSLNRYLSTIQPLLLPTLFKKQSTQHHWAQCSFTPTSLSPSPGKLISGSCLQLQFWALHSCCNQLRHFKTLSALWIIQFGEISRNAWFTINDEVLNHPLPSLMKHRAECSVLNSN